MNPAKLVLKRFGTLLLTISFFTPTFAQNEGPAIGQWRSFLPYYQVEALAYNEAKGIIFCATDYGFFTYDLKNGSIESYSKVNGMHDVGMSDVAFDSKTGYALLTYKNGNIDLFRNHRFSNIPDLKNSGLTGDKTIYSASCHDGIGYVATGVGLILVDLSKKEIKVTVPFYDSSLFAAVYDAIVADGKIFAATSVGLFETNLSNPFIEDYSGWHKMDSTLYRHLTYVEGRLYAARQDSVWFYDKNTDQLSFFYQTANNLKVTHLDTDPNGLWVSSFSTGKNGKGYLLNKNARVIDSIPCHAPTAVLHIPGNGIWYADNSSFVYQSQNGLRKKTGQTTSKSFTPDGPVTASSFDISAYNGVIWVAHGGYDHTRNPTHNRTMFSVYKEGQWKNFSWLSANRWVQDFSRVIFSPILDRAYFGSVTGGLEVITNWNMQFENFSNGYLPQTYGDTEFYSVSGLAFDNNHNLWISSNGGTHELTVKTSDNQWYAMKPVSGNTAGGLPHSAADVIIDNSGEAWFLTPDGNGVVVYDDNGTLGNTSDDRYRILKTGEGNGNLPSNQVLSLAKTKDGAIWIGTTDGIAIVNCPGQVIVRKCEASLNPVKFDAFAADHLFVNQHVNAIAVDGANRKWVGTGNGVWLLTSDANGYKIVYRFTTENSPLPSNIIRRINIDPVTGDVYFSTEKGFISFRSTATDAKETDKTDLLIYPNPVPSGYHGKIAVRGVPNGADVKFTDITGKLVYQTKAFGGEAVWNGSDYTGHKVESGVYLVFIVSKDGSKKETAKLIIQK